MPVFVINYSFFNTSCGFILPAFNAGRIDERIEKISVKTTQGDPISYTLLSVPLYLTQQVFDLLIELVKDTDD